MHGKNLTKKFTIDEEELDRLVGEAMGGSRKLASDRFP